MLDRHEALHDPALDLSDTRSRRHVRYGSRVTSVVPGCHRRGSWAGLMLAQVWLTSAATMDEDRRSRLTATFAGSTSKPVEGDGVEIEHEQLRGPNNSRLLRRAALHKRARLGVVTALNEEQPSSSPVPSSLPRR